MRLKLKVEKWGNPLIFTEHKDKKKKGEGRKKGWAMYVKYQDGLPVDYVVIKGFEYVKRDSSVICKFAQKATLYMMLKGVLEEKEKKILKLEEKDTKDVISIIRAIKENYKNGAYSIDEMAIPKRPGMDFKEYNPRPAFVRGAFYLK